MTKLICSLFVLIWTRCLNKSSYIVINYDVKDKKCCDVSALVSAFYSMFPSAPATSADRSRLQSSVILYPYAHVYLLTALHTLLQLDLDLHFKAVNCTPWPPAQLQTNITRSTVPSREPAKASINSKSGNTTALCVWKLNSERVPLRRAPLLAQHFL